MKSTKLLSAACASVLACAAMAQTAFAEEAVILPYQLPLSFDNTLQDVCRQIAELDGVSVSDCFIRHCVLPEGTFMLATPKRFYGIEPALSFPVRVTTRDGEIPALPELCTAEKTGENTYDITYHLEFLEKGKDSKTAPPLSGYDLIDSLCSDAQIMSVEYQTRCYVMNSSGTPYIYVAKGAPADEIRARLPEGWNCTENDWDTTTAYIKQEGEIEDYAAYYAACYSLFRELYEDGLIQDGSACTTEFLFLSTEMPTDAWDTALRRGDLSGDNTVDIKDAVLLARLTAEDDTLTCAVQNADYNADGLVDLRDIRDMTRALTFTESE